MPKTPPSCALTTPPSFPASTGLPRSMASRDEWLCTKSCNWPFARARACEVAEVALTGPLTFSTPPAPSSFPTVSFSFNSPSPPASSPAPSVSEFACPDFEGVAGSPTVRPWPFAFAAVPAPAADAASAACLRSRAPSLPGFPPFVSPCRTRRRARSSVRSLSLSAVCSLARSPSRTRTSQAVPS